MRTRHIFRAWRAILRGRTPLVSLEITRECPLRCPGCYAYEPAHLPGHVPLRLIEDSKGDRLVENVLTLVDDLKPVHLSIVGGDPLVRYRELEKLVPQLLEREITVQIVTSAFRPIPADWSSRERLEIVVSIDGLRAEHDERRKPATYDRILDNIRGQFVVVHCTITGQMMKRSGYLREFVQFWSANENVRKIWMSIFTPQRGALLPEVPTETERQQIISDLLVLRREYSKLDMGAELIEAYRRPPSSPDKCTFARTTKSISADLKTVITPCQFGGDPDCSRCGCIASAGFHAVASHRLAPGIAVGSLFDLSVNIGQKLAKISG